MRTNIKKKKKKSSKKICDNALRKQDLKLFNGDSNYSDDLNVHLNYRLFCPLQWGYEYRPFEYRKNLNTELFEVWISNGRSMGYVLCSRPTIQIPDQYIRKLDGVHMSNIQMVGLYSI